MIGQPAETARNRGFGQSGATFLSYHFDSQPWIAGRQGKFITLGAPHAALDRSQIGQIRRIVVQT